MKVQSRGPQPALKMKTNPRGTGFSQTHPSIPQPGSSRGRSFRSPAAFVRLPGVGVSCFRATPASLCTIRCRRRNLRTKPAFTLTWTAPPPCLSVTGCQGHTFHRNAPRGAPLAPTSNAPAPNGPGRAFSPANTDYDDRAKGGEKKKKYLGNPTKSSLLKKPGERTHTTARGG